MKGLLVSHMRQSAYLNFLQVENFAPLFVNKFMVNNIYSMICFFLMHLEEEEDPVQILPSKKMNYYTRLEVCNNPYKHI